MNGFLFSRTFLLPFFISLIIFDSYLVLKFWNLYKDDFAAKAIPSGFIWEWIWRQASGTFLQQSFLLAFLTGIIFYSQQFFKKRRSMFRPFSLVNIVTLIIISFFAFRFVSFTEPRIYEKGMTLLSDVVFTKPGVTFKRTTPLGIATPRTMILPDLIIARETSRKFERDKIRGVQKPGINSESRSYDIQIWKKIAYPITIIVFYLLGNLLGVSSHRLRAVFVLFFTYFFFFTCWYYANAFFERLFKQEKIEAFLACFGTLFILIAIMIPWFWKLRYHDLLTEKIPELNLNTVETPEDPDQNPEFRR
jgi:hypothetical protein